MNTPTNCPLVPEHYLNNKTDELLSMAPLRVPLPKSVPKVGVMLIDDPFGGRHALMSNDMREYASRTCSTNPKSWLADKITRRLTGMVTPDYRADGDKTLRNLESNPLWHEARNRVLHRLPECDIRLVEVRSQFERTLLKEYVDTLVRQSTPTPDTALSAKETARLHQMRN
jgi:hypothetical protein